MVRITNISIACHWSLIILPHFEDVLREVILIWTLHSFVPITLIEIDWPFVLVISRTNLTDNKQNIVGQIGLKGGME